MFMFLFVRDNMTAVSMHMPSVAPPGPPPLQALRPASPGNALWMPNPKRERTTPDQDLAAMLVHALQLQPRQWCQVSFFKKDPTHEQWQKLDQSVFAKKNFNQSLLDLETWSRSGTKTQTHNTRSRTDIAVRFALVLHRTKLRRARRCEQKHKGWKTASYKLQNRPHLGLPQESETAAIFFPSQIIKTFTRRRKRREEEVKCFVRFECVSRTQSILEVLVSWRGEREDERDSSYVNKWRFPMTEVQSQFTKEHSISPATVLSSCLLKCACGVLQQRSF